MGCTIGQLINYHFLLFGHILAGQCIWCNHIGRNIGFSWSTCPQLDEYEDFRWCRFLSLYLVKLVKLWLLVICPGVHDITIVLEMSILLYRLVTLLPFSWYLAASSVLLTFLFKALSKCKFVFLSLAILLALHCYLDADVRLARRIKRDTVDRGRDVHSVLEQARIIFPFIKLNWYNILNCANWEISGMGWFLEKTSERLEQVFK